jgi:sarcosine oxidase
MEHDVVVVGGGVMGLAAAAALAGTGRTVVLLEQFDQGHDRGGSHGTSRIFRLGYPDPFYVDLAVRCLPAWRSLEAAAGTTLVTTTGAIDHGLDQRQTAEQIAALTGQGQRVETVDPAAARERWPGIAFETAVLHQPDGGWIRADAVLAALARLAVGRGADLRYTCPVTALRVRGDRVELETPGGAVVARQVVVAAGPWTNHLVRDVVALPRISTTREQPALFPIRSNSDTSDTWPAFIHWRAEDGPYGRAPGYGLVAPGVGIKVGLHHAGPVVDPAALSADQRPDDALHRAVRDYVERWVPGLDPDGALVQTCLYDTTDSEDFVLDRVGPVTIATGFSGHGFKFAPVIGQIVTGLVAGTASAPERLSVAGHRRQGERA